jgi:hypothetical protein
MDVTIDGVSDLMIGFIGLLIQSLVITIDYNNTKTKPPHNFPQLLTENTQDFVACRSVIRQRP